MVNHKGLAKNHLGQVLSQPAANTNQILIEDVLQLVIKVIKSIKSTSGEISVKNNKKQWGKACPCAGGGVSTGR